MKFYQPIRVRLPAWADWFALALMAVAARAISPVAGVTNGLIGLGEEVT